MGAGKSLFGLKTWVELMRSASHLIYPSTCIICEGELSSSDNSICSFCLPELDFTHFEKYTEPTPLDKLFWGRVKLEHTYSLLYFEKERSTQKILHSLKYKHNPQVGIEFGRLIGEKFKSLPISKNIDAIVPVPLHPKKEFQRGYNQSAELAKGISEMIGVPIDEKFLAKKIHTGSQTSKGRFSRWDNVSQNFRLKTQGQFKHILLVDDVITTGSTLESIIRTVTENYPDLRISIVSLALAK
jgi:ComF family protein